MTIHIALNHKTLYDYDRSVEMGPQVIRLRPAPHSRTPIESYALKIEPSGHFLNWQQDPFGNYLARVVFPEKVRKFSVEVDLVADMVVFNPFDFFLEPAAETFPFSYDADLAQDLKPFLEKAAPGPLLKDWLARYPKPKDVPTVDFLVALNQKLRESVDYVIRMEPGVQTPEETLQIARGSCRDSSWLLVQILRHFGLAARFVSGYLIQLVADVKSLDGPSGTDRDFTDLHAWVEVFLPGAGWVGLDPTSGLFAGEGHIPLACTPHPSSAAPISGALEYAETTFSHDMKVTRVFETARVTKPYSEEQWQAVERFAEKIDADLTEHDVRLTIGGEPTFVSIDHPDEEEWNTAAIGPTKEARAADLIGRLKARYAPNGFIHFGLGKWYPGEQLPRWAYSLYWRADGKPVWRHDELIAISSKATPPNDNDARKFAQSIAARLEIGPGAITPAYEDPWHFVDQERKLPENLDPGSNKLDDPMARQRLAQVFERGLSRPTGYVLPVQRWQSKAGSRWYSQAWSTRAKHLYLLPGDSPMGLRLPLPSLPYVPPVNYPYIVPTDPFAARGPLPDTNPQRQPFLRKNGDPNAVRQTVVGQNAKGGDGRIVRAAMTVEPRGGYLWVFMPPVESVEDYLDLVAAVEDAAEESVLPIRMEGYVPPTDHRLNVIKVTPDPGVIEVNVQPAGNWQEMQAITEGLYEEARLSRLGTEKFMIDGRHTGTGGGNHVVLGAADPADSPFLRRPDLLRSLLTYWQHHPSLSYLFSGLFIGPTSQAPRVDEARHDTLHELELAFTQVPSMDADNVAPWVVDRIFRNLLTDVSGNTHRSEICIDKLYSPDGPTGRLGLVEFRAFEMPPHARMSLVQQLMLRALVARFWREPYTGNLVRWGTELHDRFMLPHYVREDLRDVVTGMQSAGYAMDEEWFAPHYEFRFPRYGAVRYRDIELELRQALEPWHVLGEEGSVGGTVRYVDSSVERLQVRATGMSGDRYAIACNGCEVPMRETGVAGEQVAGVRYRAWKPSSSLHPSIDVDAPLVFDIYDRWTGRAVGGCTYHVAHPGGRNYETFPVNSYEAESRRLARFFTEGHTPGTSPAPRKTVRPEFPYTLDLRWS